jgi:hypothetical protein
MNNNFFINLKSYTKNMTSKNLGVTSSEWTSHQPLIQSVMDFYKPKFILELGMGNFSTPFFINKGATYLGIENDEKWIEHLKENLGDMNTIFHNLGPNIKLGTHLYEISDEMKSSITEFYRNLIFPEDKPNLLFVDQYTCCRTLSLNALGNKFDIIMYHDCQPAGITWYNYNLINLQGFQIFTLKSDISWTRLMVKEYSEDFINVIQPYIEQYKKNNPDIRTMQFTR